MKRAFIASAAVGALLLAGAGAANADGAIRFDVRIGVPLYGERHAPPPPRVVVVPRARWHDRHVRYWMPARPRFHHGYGYRWHRERFESRHHEWRADAYPHRR